MKKYVCLISFALGILAALVAGICGDYGLRGTAFGLVVVSVVLIVFAPLVSDLIP